jgi:hypothetical protein
VPMEVEESKTKKKKKRSLKIESDLIDFYILTKTKLTLEIEPKSRKLKA